MDYFIPALQTSLIILSMNWKRAIESNRENLASIVAGLVAMLRVYAPLTPPSHERKGAMANASLPRVRGRDRGWGFGEEASEQDADEHPDAGRAKAPETSDKAPTLTLPHKCGREAPASSSILLPPPTYRQILNILRPAEAALRRLIVVVATILNIRVAAARARLAGQPLPDFTKFIRRALPQFPLIDPRKSFAPAPEQETPTHQSGIPRISIPGIFDPVFETRSYDDIDASSIVRRIAALDHALKTLPKQARRLARLMKRRDAAKPGRGRVGPIRPGKPPGYRQRHLHAVDDILDECHWLVREVQYVPP